MGDFRAELAALVAAYDEHGGQWSESDVDELWHAAERARAVLDRGDAAGSPAGAAATAAVAAAIAAGQPVTLPSGAVIADPAWFESRIAIRAVLAQPEPAPAADGEVAELVEAMRNQAYNARQYTTFYLLHCAADLLERQAAAAPVARLPEDAQVIEPANHTILVPVPAPVPVSERLPEKAEMTDDDEVWVEYPGGEYPLGDTGDYDWEPHKWILSPIAKFTIRENRRWLPAHALPLPEVE